MMKPNAKKACLDTIDAVFDASILTKNCQRCQAKACCNKEPFYSVLFVSRAAGVF